MEDDFSVPHYKIKMVENTQLLPREKRIGAIKRCGNNVFSLKSEEVFIDLLSDSGTSAMSDSQWASMFHGDEAYSGSKSFFRLKEAVQEVMGFPLIIPAHQGRAAEKILDEVLVKKGDVIPGNWHFDTTRAHIEYQGAIGIDCVTKEALEPAIFHPFKGNIDLEKLESVIKKHGKEKIPYILLTITCNSMGGQPVSIQNIRDTKKLADQYGIPLFFDAARFAENAFFIKKREKEFENHSIGEIVAEMFSYVDACTMSAKKDAIVNIGGFIGLRNQELYDKLVPIAILLEGYPTYGGMSGRDMEAVATGLREVISEEYLAARIGQVAYLARKLDEAGIPIIKPPGGHAVFVDGKAFLPHIPQEQFPSQALCTQLYIESGIRAVEIGTCLAGRNPQTGKNVMPKLDLMRLTIPRRVYLREHMDYIVESLKRLYARREQIKGLKFSFEATGIRHFKSRFEVIE
ncbi:tryptophanase [Candidatus Micrarchaeota archaeon]|nr:tryptophanase [Candidatus Micrarchaeota archaeon]MBU1930565.1 tryptophanase [Candidatus Micrarchaeota archaeon]